MTPSLFPEFMGNAASAVGSGLGGLLGQLGGVLSAPRRALWSMFGAPESGEEVARNLTGDEDEGSILNKILGTGLEILGDPLTFAGGPLMRMLGGVANKGLSKAAWKAGPGYTDDAAKLIAGAPAQYRPAGLNKLLGSTPEEISGLARELPEGSSFIGGGHEGAAWSTPGGNVVRAQRMEVPVESYRNVAPAEGYRAVAPEILQPVRTVNYPGSSLQIEHLPMVQDYDAIRDPLLKAANEAKGREQLFSTGTALRQSDDAFNAGGERLARSAKARGLFPMDENTFNLGRTREGRYLTFDPGAIDPGPATPLNEVLQAGQPGYLKSALLRLLGGQGRVRNYLSQPFSTVGQGIL